MELSIVMPAFDEEARLETGVRAVLDYLGEHGIEGELIVVDDGSRDRTAEILGRLATSEDRLRGVTLPENRGKGAAVRAGVAEAAGEFVLFTDVDQSTPIAEWERLREALGQGYDVAIASREVAGAERVVPQPAHRRAMGWVFMVLRGFLVLPGFIDSQCGFKAFTGEAARTVFGRSRLDGFCFDVEILAIAALHGLRTIEVPVRWFDDTRSKVSPLRDSFRMMLDLLRIRRNRARGLYD